jgi:hypothetical protein
MKGTKSKTSAQPKAAPKTGTQGGTSSGQRSQPAPGSKYQDQPKKDTDLIIHYRGRVKRNFPKEIANMHENL